MFCIPNNEFSVTVNCNLALLSLFSSLNVCWGWLDGKALGLGLKIFEVPK